MDKLLFISLCFASVLCSAFASVCTSPQIESKSFTSKDATIVSQIAIIAEFTLRCAESNIENLLLFAEVDGKLSPVVKITGDKYQVSWTEETKKAGRGERVIRLFDDDGFAALRKTVRSNGDIQAIPSLATIGVPFSGAFNGPWVNSEILAAVIAAVVAYIAFSTRSKLLS